MSRIKNPITCYTMIIVTLFLIAGCSAYKTSTSENKPYMFRNPCASYDPPKANDYAFYNEIEDYILAECVKVVPYTEQVLSHVQEITPFGKQAAIEFLYGFPSIFQSTIGLRDAITGNFYAWINGTWENVNNLSSNDVPLIFQSGVRDDSDPWRNIDLGILFNDIFYWPDGSLIDIDDVPFIHEWASQEGGVFTEMDFLLNYGGIALADNFTLFDLNGDGIPEILIGFVESRRKESQVHGHHPFVLYTFVDGEYRERGTIPTTFWGSMFFGMSSPIFMSSLGEIVIYVSDAYYGPRAYYLRLMDDGIVLELIYPMIYCWDEFNAQYTRFYSLTKLQDEITNLITIGRWDCLAR